MKALIYPNNSKVQNQNLLNSKKKTDHLAKSKSKTDNLNKKNPDYKLDLKSKDSSNPASSSLSLPDIPKIKTPDLNKPEISSKETSSVQTDISKEVARERLKTEMNKVYEKDLVPKKLNEPAIFFIKGSEFVSSSTSGTYSGMEKLSDNIENAKVFDWNQKDEIKTLIRRTRDTQPVILVGHSFGSDTAYEIADEMNNLENGFRKVDLLVTLDSVGYSNDIIPSNVVKNMNFISEGSFFSDAPNVAKDGERTTVENKLLEIDHTDIDDDSEVQREIVDNIKSIVSLKTHRESLQNYENKIKNLNKKEMS